MGFSDLNCFLLPILILSAMLDISYGEDLSSYYNLSAPLAVSVQQGQCVYISCTFKVHPVNAPSASALGTWYKDSSNGPIFTSQNKSLIPENNKEWILFTGDATKYDCSMAIKEAQRSDAGQYLFRLVDGPRSWNYEKYKMTITVNELTERPAINSNTTLVAGEQVTLTCESPWRCSGPAPLITWSGRIEGRNVSYITSYPDGNKTFSSNVTFTPSKQDHQSSLTCTVTFRRSSATTSRQLVLNVEYPPVVTVTSQDVVQNGNAVVTVIEGDTNLLNCTVDSNPQADITWYKGDISLSGSLEGQSLTYELKNVRPNDAGIYRCSANNRRGTNEKTISINVEYAPHTLSISCSMNAGCTIDANHTAYFKEGSSVSLECSAASNPLATVTWTNPRNQSLRPPNNQISFSNIVIDDEGLYTCLATNKHGNSSASVTIRVTYAPRAVPGLNSACMELGSHIECFCIIQSFPEAIIQWNIDEISFSSSDSGLQITTLRAPPVTNSTMTLQISKGTVPHVECIGSNMYGNLVLSLLDKKYAPRAVPGLNSTCKELGNYIKCFCIFQSIPEAIIQWKIDEKSFNRSDSGLQITTLRAPPVTNSTMTLQISQGNVPHVECLGSNKYGEQVLSLLDKKSSSIVPVVVSVTVVIAVAVILGIALIVLLYYRKRKSKQESPDKKEHPVPGGETIYANSPIYFNTNEEVAQQRNQDDGALYINGGDVQYASIDFSKLKPRPQEVTEPETEYAVIKPKPK